MKTPLSIRARLVWGAAVVLLAFLAVAGWAVQQAYADSVRAQRFARLQSTIYLLMAGAELNTTGALVMPATLAEPRLSLPASGLYANIANVDKSEEWQSSSTLGLNPPFQRSQAPGQWHFDTVAAPPAKSGENRGMSSEFLAATYAVKWSVNDQVAPLVFSVLEDKSEFDRELRAFERTLWSWLGGAGLLLLLTQTLLLRWGLAPLGQMAREIQRIEKGEKAKVEQASHFQGHPVGSHQPRVRRHDVRLAGERRHSHGNGLVVAHAALHEDLLAHLPEAFHPVHIVDAN